MKEPNRPEERRRTRVKNTAAAIIKAEGGVEKAKELAEPVQKASRRSG